MPGIRNIMNLILQYLKEYRKNPGENNIKRGISNSYKISRMLEIPGFFWSIRALYEYRFAKNLSK